VRAKFPAPIRVMVALFVRLRAIHGEDSKDIAINAKIAEI
jgi:hypothetical protein